MKEIWIIEYYDKNPQVEPGSFSTCINATIEVAGKIIVIESVGDSYTNETMEIKQEIATSLGCARVERV